MSEMEELNNGQEAPTPNPNRTYFIAAAVLLVIIVVAAVLLITQGIPALIGDDEPTSAADVEPTATQVATLTPGPTAEPTSTQPAATPTLPPLVMSDTDTPVFDFESAGARPGVEWTGFFGQVFDTEGNPVEGVPVIVWYRDGQAASEPTPTDQDGSYEIVLAEAPLAGTWTIQLLTEDGYPASKLFTFQTDEDTKTGIQQIQVLWRQIP